MHGKGKLIKVFDFLGREKNKNSKEPLIYLYSDGSVEKKIIVD